jgi:hypothetical protein
MSCRVGTIFDIFGIASDLCWIYFFNSRYTGWMNGGSDGWFRPASKMSIPAGLVLDGVIVVHTDTLAVSTVEQ